MLMFDRSFMDSHSGEFNMRVGENSIQRVKNLVYDQKKNPKRCSRGLLDRKESLNGMKINEDMVS